jgi:hypothetical protein
MNNSIITQSGKDDQKLKLFVNIEASYTSPYPNASVAGVATSNMRDDMELSCPDEHQKLVRSRWDWDQFEAHNVEWKRAIAALPQIYDPDRNSSQEARWYYMDVWNMALQRPDAHTQTLDRNHGYYDCLHCE